MRLSGLPSGAGSSATARGSRRRPIAVAGALLLISASSVPSSCGGEAGSASQRSSEVEELLEKTARAQRSFSFRGERVHSTREIGTHGAEPPSTFTERVFHRGPVFDRSNHLREAERFLVELERLSRAPRGMSPEGEINIGAFKTSYRQRSGFIERYREPRISDVQLLLSHRQARLHGREEEVAGRPCKVLDLWPSVSRRSSIGRGAYRLWIDRQWHIILRWEEYDGREGIAKGPPIARTTYQKIAELDRGEEVDWPQIEGSRKEIGLDELPAFLQGRFVAATPLLPPGFRHTSRRMLEVALSGQGVKAMVDEWSDGLEKLILIHAVLDATPMGLDTPPRPTARVIVHRFGRTRAFELEHDGILFFFVGKGEKRDLQAVLDSLFR